VRRIYQPAHIRFLSKHISGKSYRELALLFNKRFGLSATEKAIKSLCIRNRLCNGFGHGNPNYPPPRKFTDRHVKFIKKIVKGRNYAEVAELFNLEFGLSATRIQISSLCKRKGLTNGIDMLFPKGHTPLNKGRKGYCAPGSEKGWFAPGHPGYKYKEMPIGSERVANGYIWVKISNKSGPNKNRWRQKHILIWEKTNGPVPKGHAILFADGNRKNINLNNLLLVSRKELAILNHMGMLSANKNINVTAVNIARLKILTADSKRGTWKSGGKRKLVVIDNTGKRVFVSHGSGRNRKRWIAVRETKTGLQELWAKKIKARNKFEDAQRDLREYAIFRGWQKASMTLYPI